MRKNLFSRGKRVDTGAWVEGWYHSDGFSHYIRVVNVDYEAGGIGGISRDDFRVLPETVGQYTGLDDKHGKRIFEGDVIDNEEPDGRFTKSVVEYRKEYAAFMCRSKDMVGLLLSKPNRVIIGNIHDNPELLEVQS